MRTTQMRIDRSLFPEQSLNQTFFWGSMNVTQLHKTGAHISLSFPPHHGSNQEENEPETQQERFFTMGLYSFTSASLSASARLPWSRASWSFSSESHLTKFQTYPIIHSFSLREMHRVLFACLFLILFADMFKGFPKLTSLLFTLLQKTPFYFQD